MKSHQALELAQSSRSLLRKRRKSALPQISERSCLGQLCSQTIFLFSFSKKSWEEPLLSNIHMNRMGFKVLESQRSFIRRLREGPAPQSSLGSDCSGFIYHISHIYGHTNMCLLLGCNTFYSPSHFIILGNTTLFHPTTLVLNIFDIIQSLNPLFQNPLPPPGLFAILFWSGGIFIYNFLVS